MSQGEQSPTLAQMKLSDEPSKSPDPVVVDSSSSSEGSLQIEVAEPEDIDSHTGPTVWRTAGDLTELEPADPSIMMSEFPCIDRNRDIVQGIEHLAWRLKHCEKLSSIGASGLLDADALPAEHSEPVLSRLSGWIDSYMGATRHRLHQWFDMVVANRDFWDTVPLLVLHLSERRFVAPTGSFSKTSITLLNRPSTHSEDDYAFFYSDGISGEDGSPSPLSRFFVSYASLTARMLNTDLQTLKETIVDTNASPDLIGAEYLKGFRRISFTTIFFRVQDNLRWPTDEAIMSATEALIQQLDGGIDGLTQQVVLLLSRSPLDTEAINNLFEIVKNIMMTFSRILSNEDSAESIPGLNSGEYQVSLWSFFQTVDAKFQELICKQNSALNMDSIRSMIEAYLTPILYSAVQFFGVNTDAYVPEQFRPELDALLMLEKMFFVWSAWKMRLLKKCIMQGRMDSRALGVEMMSEHLVDAYQKFINQKRIDPLHLVPRFLADFIIENDLVSYLVGVESHTQLVSRSKNVIGFLIVSQRYTEKETDTIWNAVLTSQDSRFSDAVMNTALGFIELSPADVVCYWFGKLNKLAVKHFELPYIRTFAETLTNMMAKFESPDMDETGHHSFWVRLIQEAYNTPDVSPDKRKEILSFAMHVFKMSVQPRLRDSDREAIYAQCVASISRGSPLSIGSIAVLNQLLDGSLLRRDADLKMLESEYHLTNEIVKDFSRLAHSKAASDTHNRGSAELLGERLKVISKIISFLPESLTSDLTKELWEALVGEKSVGDKCRDTAWLMLAKAINGSKSRANCFFEKVLHEHFRKLSSECFTISVFPFVKAATGYEQNLVPQTDEGQELQRKICAGELYWPVSLKAKSSELGNKAIQNLVETQLKSQDGKTEDISKVMDAHALFVARAVQHLTTASQELQRLTDGTSSGEDDAMVIIATDDEVAAARLRFIRSLTILHKFVQQARLHRSFSPDLSVKSSDSPAQINGEEVSFRYQPHVGGKALDFRTLKIGDAETVEEMLEQLKHATGFLKFVLIAGGQKLDQHLQKDTKIRDLDILRNPGPLLIQKQPGSKSQKIYKSMGGLNRVELEIMKHFSVFYNLLGLDDELGEHVYQFLSIFPPHENTAGLVYDSSKPAAVVFPPQAPYKAMYSVHVLRAVLDQHLSEGAAPHELLSRAVSILVAAVMDLPTPSGSQLNRIDTILATSYVDCLLKVLRERVSLEVSSSYFLDSKALVGRLRELIDAAISDMDQQQSEALVGKSFAAMLEASAHDATAWTAFKDECSLRSLLNLLLLECRVAQIRTDAKTSIMSLLTALPSYQEYSRNDVENFFWTVFANMIPEACAKHRHPEQFFACARELFINLNAQAKAELPLSSYVRRWSDLLIDHKHYEVVGHSYVDAVAFGLAGLLDWCIKMMMSEKKPLDLPETLAKDIFECVLFPEWSNEYAIEDMSSPLAVLDLRTRSFLYSILLATAGDMPGFASLVDIVSVIDPGFEQSNAWAWGLAQPNDDRGYNPNWEVERSQTMRSSTGYSGLKNLQNTCYMNSLLTQLYMNVDFRRFLLNAHVSDPLGSQKLLHETQRLLAYMQTSWLRAVDPDNVTDVLVTYEGTPIDVSIQMDVDEFYNLLFDRWESQLPGEEEKKKFRSFYGGDIIQQIKSKDCSHVSERVESFSAIQCDIQGKPNLEESLKAYVGGEIMEGDNKYKCSSCGTYVNAVKRACFKHLPDNLIFHLKRFDYDLMMGTRSKINDRFEFPDQLDMTPYHVDQLQDPDSPQEPDSFTLVGVLVHSGSAEAGHYYSYIRERPCSRGTWLEFNDTDVTPYNPAHMESNCFGGWQDQFYHNMVQFPRTWNAYMLFYQRTSALETEGQSVSPVSELQPARIAVSDELNNRITAENVEFLRMYSLFDAEYAKFTRSLFDKYFSLSNDYCSDDHKTEDKLLRFGLQHIVNVFTRQKDCRELFTIMHNVGKFAVSCLSCCNCFLSWIATHTHDFRLLLLRCPYEQVRTKIVNILFVSIRFLRDHDMDQYGPQTDAFHSDHFGDDAEDPMGTAADHGVSLDKIVEIFHDMLQYLPLHSRGWEEFFGFLTRLALLSPLERIALHEHGFLSHCLEVLVLMRNKTIVRAMPHQQAFARHLERRVYPIHNLVCLVEVLLRNADFGETPEDEPSPDMVNPSVAPPRFYYRLTVEEENLVEWCDPKARIQGIAFLEEIFLSARNCADAYCSIVKKLVRHHPSGLVSEKLFNTLISGVNVSPPALARSFLRGALAFCETSRHEEQIKEMYDVYARDIIVDDYHGLEHLDFFNRFRTLRNEHINDQKPSLFQRLTVSYLHIFGPPLLYSREGRVRREMLMLVKLVLFTSEEVAAEEGSFDSEEIEHAIHRLCKGCLLQAERLVARREIVSVHRIAETENVLKHYQSMAATEEMESDLTLHNRIAGKISLEIRNRSAIVTKMLHRYN